MILYFQVTMQSSSHSLGLGGYSVGQSHLPPLKPGPGSAGQLTTSSGPAGHTGHPSPDLDCGPNVDTGYNDKSPGSWKYQSFQVL